MKKILLILLIMTGLNVTYAEWVPAEIPENAVKKEGESCIFEIKHVEHPDDSCVVS